MTEVVYSNRVWLDSDNRESAHIKTYIEQWGEHGGNKDWTVEIAGSGSTSPAYIQGEIEDYGALDLLIIQLTHLRNQVEMYGKKDTAIQEQS